MPLNLDDDDDDDGGVYSSIEPPVSGIEISRCVLMKLKAMNCES